jgi:shikimate kinase
MQLLPPPAHEELCITLIGMPGAGKSTLGSLLARHLQWAFVDTDLLIEAAYGAELQSITNAMSKEDFLNVEASVVSSVRAHRTVLATGGSVVYRAQAMEHLRALGPVLYLHVPFALIEERVARNPERGLAIAPGQTLTHLYEERRALYEHYATLSISTENLTPQESVQAVLSALQKQHILPQR